MIEQVSERIRVFINECKFWRDEGLVVPPDRVADVGQKVCDILEIPEGGINEFRPYDAGVQMIWHKNGVEHEINIDSSDTIMCEVLLDIQ